MNPYDDEPTYRGESRSSRRPRAEDYPGGRDPYEGYAEPTTRPVTGRASVGRASVSPSYSEPTTRPVAGRASVSGSASVRPTSPAEEPVYGAPYGDAAYGGAGSEPVYGAPYGDAAYGSSSSYGSEPVSPSRGSAPVSPGRGSAPVSPSGVGRAQVRPVSPSTPPPAAGGGRGPNGPYGPNGPHGGRPVPGAPGGDGPAGRGPGDPSGRRPFRGFGLGGERRGRGPGGPEDRKAARGKLSRNARIRNIIIASVALLVMLSGGGFIGFTLYADGIPVSDQLTLPETTTLYYSDGTEMLKLGENTRFVVPYDNMSPYVIEALIASEDETFWTNEGVQFSAIVRAAWNNITGGSTQGGSTITQQYARVAFDLQGATYNRKIREAVVAWKLSDQMPKQEIIANYLNVVPFGRQTFGAEAAALAFFGKSIKKDAPPDKQITRSEAMALVAMVKQPEIDQSNPEAYPGYDPTRGEEGSVMRENAVKNAVGRWEYVRRQLVDLSKADPQRFTLTEEEAATLEFPTTWIPADQYRNADLTKPEGLIRNHVLDELTHTPGSYFENWPWENIENGGYQIITTLHPGAQAAAVGAADETVPGSVMHGQPDNMQAAIVGVEPGTGRVLAYFGGHKGDGNDYAGIFQDEDGDWAGYGGHPPGSSAKVYTLAAALRAGYSVNSYWQWTEHDQQGRAAGNRVRNASQCTSDWDREKREARSGLCSLLESTKQSLNVPFYDVTISVSTAAVLQMAMDAGIEHIWNDNLERTDLMTLPGGAVDAVQGRGIGPEVGIGQYRYTVLDHANGMATFAAGGLRANAHFVIEVRKGEQKFFGETLPNPDSARILNQAQIDTLNYALAQVANININGFQAATKTGTWEYNQRMDANAHAWNVGYTSVLAAAAWVGPKGDEVELLDKNGNDVWGSTLPREIWEQFMRDATAAMALDGPKQFNPPNPNLGIDVPPGAYPSPTPSATPTPTPTTTTPARPTTTPPSTTTTTTTTTGNGGGDDEEDDS